MSNVQRVAGAIAAVAAVILGLFLESWPRWVIFGVAAIAIVAIIFEYFAHSDAESAATVKQRNTQRAGKNSQQIQASGDVHVDGRMGND